MSVRLMSTKLPLEIRKVEWNEQLTFLSLLILTQNYRTNGIHMTQAILRLPSMKLCQVLEVQHYNQQLLYTSLMISGIKKKMCTCFKSIVNTSKLELKYIFETI